MYKRECVLVIVIVCVCVCLVYMNNDHNRYTCSDYSDRKAMHNGELLGMYIHMHTYVHV
jgi:hypothetical protein